LTSSDRYSKITYAYILRDIIFQLAPIYFLLTILTPPLELKEEDRRSDSVIRADDLEPLISTSPKLNNILERTLAVAKHAHHADVDGGHAALDTVGQDNALGELSTHVLEADNLGTGLECGDEVLDDLLGVLLGPVVEDVLEQVKVGGDGLGGEEVVGLELDAVLELGRDSGLVVWLALGQILDGDLDIREGRGEDDVVVAGRTTNLKKDDVSAKGSMKI
jgi:hypothetical protein